MRSRGAADKVEIRRKGRRGAKRKRRHRTGTSCRFLAILGGRTGRTGRLSHCPRTSTVQRTAADSLSMPAHGRPGWATCLTITQHSTSVP